ncbi:hypothetical protein FB45DRAFT_986640 [Roridomyces roridus]|uniref:Fe2OG dioxygenase domain-containing protein n=1 Tax=Roridomyces roridus TaxID=1738132 RepID=A0AAD7FZ43_9AGAR|nr:hypothetical protein FB45DRAFT_986640 [Roridomyces roridus]
MAGSSNDDVQIQIDALCTALTTGVPYTSGLHTVKHDDLVVYYELEGETRPCRIDLSKASDAELVALNAACQQATFGVGGNDVLDENYRKAGKMDVQNFSLRFDVAALLEKVSPEILHGRGHNKVIEENKFLRAEMYKLNVYGPGSFFKAHKDTPRGEDMIGSLVVVFPTNHEGGALTLEHGGKNWVFDSAAELSAVSESPSIAYIAFYSDVTHTVETVNAGYRVTLTYNLFVASRNDGIDTIQRNISEPERAFEKGLRALLANPSFLPSGGFLAFGLAHQYPIPVKPLLRAGRLRGRGLPGILPLLKGNDALIRAISEHVGLETQLKVHYITDQIGRDILADDVIQTGHIVEDQGELQDQLEELGEPVHGSDDDDPAGVVVVWVTELTELNPVEATYVAYGNEASTGHIYGDVALFVEIPEVGEGIRA